MRRYIVDIFTAEFNADYVNGRLRVGMVHKRIGVSPKLYLSSVRILKEVVSEHLREIDAFDATGAIDASVALAAMAEAAMTGAEATATMAAVAGRAAYVPDEQVQGTPDPGAMAVAFALRAAATATLAK